MPVADPLVTTPDLIEILRDHGRTRPDAVALSDHNQQVSYRRLWSEVKRLSEVLKEVYHRPTIGLLAANGPGWAVVDLAALAAGVTLVPIPPFFSPAQIRHVVVDAGIDLVITDDPESVAAAFAGSGVAVKVEMPILVLDGVYQVVSPSPVERVVHRGIAKITYTSGTTGEPKGVCLSRQTIATVVASLAEVTGADSEDRHLALVPLSTLLENIAGVYLPLLVGGCSCLPSLPEVGVMGGAGIDRRRLIATMESFGATSAAVIPQILQAVVEGVETGLSRPDRLRYLAVGGAPVSERLLARAEALGLPVFEGYGLSECASVVSVNTPQACRPGSVGKPLPHVRLRFADDGEILASGALFERYLGTGVAPVDGYWPTGDIGHLDEDGFLHLTGRKKNIFITSFGRNVSPEWVERELSLQPALGQALVHGEGRPFNVAVIVPATPLTTDDEISAAVDSANATLPEYARVSAWVRAVEPFTVGNGQLTGTGRPRREAVVDAHRPFIETLYERKESP